MWASFLHPEPCENHQSRSTQTANIVTRVFTSQRFVLRTRLLGFCTSSSLKTLATAQVQHHLQHYSGLYTQGSIELMMNMFLTFITLQNSEQVFLSCSYMTASWQLTMLSPLSICFDLRLRYMNRSRKVVLLGSVTALIR